MSTIQHFRVLHYNFWNLFPKSYFLMLTKNKFYDLEGKKQVSCQKIKQTPLHQQKIFDENFFNYSHRTHEELLVRAFYF